HSGDLATMDEEGFISIVDRKKNMIKTGGHSVFSMEVEDTILRLPQVSEVAVIGLPDADLMEAVTAVIVVKPSQSLKEAEVIRFCEQHLAPSEVPKRVIFTAELPRKPSGNLLKVELRAKYA